MTPISSPKAFSRMGWIPKRDGWQTSTAPSLLHMETACWQSFFPIFVICLLLLLIYLFAQHADFSCLLIVAQYPAQNQSLREQCCQRHHVEKDWQKRGCPGSGSWGHEAGGAVWIWPPFPSYYRWVICLASLSFTFLFHKVWNSKTYLWGYSEDWMWYM